MTQYDDSEDAATSGQLDSLHVKSTNATQEGTHAENHEGTKDEDISNAASITAAATPTAAGGGNTAAASHGADNPFLYDGQSNLLVRIAQQKAEADRINGDRDVTTVRRKQREGALRQIFARRQHARRQFELVEDLFTQSVERRLRALRRIADDPPAERLIGHHVAQYIPAALLPGELRRVQGNLNTTTTTVSPHAALPSTEEVKAITAGQEGTDKGPVALTGPTPIVFLTELGHDAKQRTNEKKNESSKSKGLVDTQARQDDMSPHASSRSSSAESNEIGNTKSAARESAQRWVSVQEAELAAQWRELGYDVLYLNSRRGSRRLAPMSSRQSQTEEQVQPSEAESSVVPPTAGAHTVTMTVTGGTTTTSVNNTRAEWVKTGLRLAPLPHICLVQRRLTPLVTAAAGHKAAESPVRPQLPSSVTVSGHTKESQPELSSGKSLEKKKEGMQQPWWMTPHRAWSKPVLKKPASRVCTKYEKQK